MNVVWIAVEEELEKEGYSLIPLRGEASRLFPPYRCIPGGIEYEVQPLIPLTEWPCEGTKPEEILRLTEQLHRLPACLEEYLVDEDSVSWQTDHVFWNEYRQELQVLYTPGGGGGTLTQLKEAWVQQITARIVRQNWEKEDAILFAIRLCQHLLKERALYVSPAEKAVINEDPVSSESDKQEKRKMRFLFLPR